MNERLLGERFDESYFEAIDTIDKTKELRSEELNQAAKSLDMEKDKARSNGEELDKVSGVWKEYEPKHQEISAVIDALKRVLGDNEKTVEEHQEAINKATSFLKEGAEFFRKENDLVYGEIKEMNQNLEAISEMIAAIKERDVRRISPDKVMDAVKKGMELQNEFKTLTETILKQQHQDNRITEIKKAGEYIKDKVEQIRRSPSMIKDAIERKAYETVDNGLLKVSELFDKGINELQQQRDFIKGISHRLKDEREKETGKPLKNAVRREQGGMSR